MGGPYSAGHRHPNRLIGGGPSRESEGPIVPRKRVKASGGKGPWF